MSKDCSGLPGMRIAFTHLVCVVAGAPGPAQSARAAPVDTRITPPITARVSSEASTVAFENRLDVGILSSFACNSANRSEDFRVMTQPPHGLRRRSLRVSGLPAPVDIEASRFRGGQPLAA